MAKAKGKAVAIAESPRERATVTDLMDALRQSLETTGKPSAKKRPTHARRSTRKSA